MNETTYATNRRDNQNLQGQDRPKEVCKAGTFKPSQASQPGLPERMGAEQRSTQQHGPVAPGPGEPVSLRCGSTNPSAIRAAAAFPGKLAAVHGDKISIRAGAIYFGNGSNPSSRGKGIDVHCNVCGHDWSPKANHLLNGAGCPNCRRLGNIASAGVKRCLRATKAEKDRAFELRAQGLTCEQIGAELGRANATICRWLNPDVVKKSRQRQAKWDAENRERKRANSRRYRTEFPHGKASSKAHNAHRRKLKQGWFEYLEDGTKIEGMDPPAAGAELSKEQAYYLECERITRETGIEHHVDHIWPLAKGGPHAWWNLQILTAEENLSKRDKFRPEDRALYIQRIVHLFNEN